MASLPFGDRVQADRSRTDFGCARLGESAYCAQISGRINRAFRVTGFPPG
jgi:hypothetical protein